MKKILLIITFSFLVLACKSYKASQQSNKSNDFVSVFFHFEKVKLGSMMLNHSNTVIGFVFRSVDTLGKTNWQSDTVVDYKIQRLSYFFKLNVPKNVANNSSMFKCETIFQVAAPGKKIDTVSYNYGGSTKCIINLHLNSTPKDADVFLIPNEIWLNDFENKPWKKDSSLLEDYRVHTRTNTYTKIDETVYVALFKFKNKYIKRIIYTQPALVEPNPIVSVNF